MSDGLFLDARYSSVQRALGDFQSGNPIVVCDGDLARLVLSIEALNPSRLQAFRNQAKGQLSLVISASKALVATDEAAQASSLPLLASESCQDIVTSVTAPDARLARRASIGDRIDGAVVELAKLCRLLPAAVTLPLARADQFPAALQVTVDDVMTFRDVNVESLKLISRAKVNLRWGSDSEFIVFRDALGASCTAVVIGQPDFSKPVQVRIHSSCLTGDSFGSLRCDCGDQLRMSIEFLRDGGGVLLYLDQEGCGIGLANKMRAYALQDLGLDTIDANIALGFASDERRYTVAARMLNLLGISQVLLLTNNPSKVSGLSDSGIAILGRIPLIAPVNGDNRRYLDAKARRAGHLLDETHDCADHATSV